MMETEARILVVDDEEGVREGCRRILAAEGFAVNTAADGVEALALFEKDPRYAVALVDLRMPRLGGLELTRTLRERDPNLVVVIITAYATIETAVEGTKQGAYSYIPKPFTPDELLLAIRNGLERRALALEAGRLRDERERRLLELAAERSKSNTILGCMTDGVLVINLEKLIVLRNAAATRILSDAAARTVPFPLQDLQCAEVRDLIREVLDGEPGPRILSREVTLDKLTYMVNVSPVVEPDGGTSGAVAVFRDIMELKELENAKSMFVSMVAHELKNPLAATESWLSLILSGTVEISPEEQRKMIERSLLRVRTLRALVSELLSLRSIEAGSFALNRSPVQIRPIVEEAMAAAGERAAAKRIELSLIADFPEEAGQVLADGDALSVVFSNLIDNAIKYTPDGGHVTVRAGQDGTTVTVTVQDDGVGMSAEELERVFEEFYRAKNQRTADIPGTGLGLSLIKRLVELHHGSVTARSAPEKGSSFTVSLPL